MHPDEPSEPTALSAVFRRLEGTPPPRPAPMAGARPAPPAAPQLLGFAEPVTQVPPVEAFLPVEEAVGHVEPAPSEAAVQPTPEPEPMPKPELEAEPEAELELEPEFEAEPSPPIRARVRELPPAQPPQARSQTLVGRLNRRPSEPLSEQAEAVISSPGSAPERAGRPSLPRNRRLYRRAKLPAEIEIDGVPCTLIDVSVGGFAATGVPEFEPNALVPVTLRLVIDGIEVGTQLKGRIIYVTQGRSSGRFVDLGPSQMAFLRYIVTWRGESVGAVGTTTLLDAISGGLERASGMGERFDAPKSRWWAGLIGRKATPAR